MSDSKRRAVVTGAASGIGYAVGQRLLHEGHQVVAVDLNEAGLRPLVDDGATAFVGDLASAEVRDRLIVLAAGFDYLVNSAGMLRLKPILDLTTDDLRKIYAVNVEATWDLVSRIGRTMPFGGAIVNLSSSSAKLPWSTEAAAYASSKAAVLSITRSFAYAFAARNVRVNAVCPGIIDTPMQDAFLAGLATARAANASDLGAARLGTVPLGRLASAEECATVICFLLSDDASYMTGQAINITGGQVMW